MYKVKAVKSTIFLNDLDKVISSDSWTLIKKTKFEGSEDIARILKLGLIIIEQVEDDSDNDIEQVSIDDYVVSSVETWSSAKIKNELTKVQPVLDYNDLLNKPNIPVDTANLFKSDVYTKTEVDANITALDNAINAVSTTVNSALDTVTTTLNSNIDTKVSAAVDTINTSVNSIMNTAITSLNSTLNENLQGINTTLSNKAEIDHTHTELHTHNNQDILDSFSDVAGILMYNNAQVIYPINDNNLALTNTFSSQHINDLLVSKSNTDHIHNELHNHDNIDVLSLLSDNAGNLQYNGTDIVGANAALIDDTKTTTDNVWSSQMVSNQLDNKATLTHNHTQYEFANRAVLLKFAEVNNRIQYNGFNIDGIKSILIGTNLITNTAFELREGTNIRLDVSGNTITISSVAGTSSGTAYTDTQFYSKQFDNIIAPSTQTITISSGTTNFMPVVVYRLNIDTGAWRQCVLGTDYNLEFINDLNISIEFSVDGTYKVVYGVYIGVDSSADVILPGGEF